MMWGSREAVGAPQADALHDAAKRTGAHPVYLSRLRLGHWVNGLLAAQLQQAGR